MKRFVWRSVGVGVATLAVVGSFSLARWIADRDPPLVYEEAFAIGDEVRQGGTITVVYQVVRDRRCAIDVRRTLTDAEGKRHSIPTYTVGSPPPMLGRDRYERRITVPPGAAPGPARYDVRLRYTCNPLQVALSWPIEVAAPPVRFDIQKRPGWLLPTHSRS